MGLTVVPNEWYPTDECPGGGTNPTYIQNGQYYTGPEVSFIRRYGTDYAITCEYDKTEDAYTRALQALSKAIHDDKDKWTTRSDDSRQEMYDAMRTKFCRQPEHLNVIVTHDLKTCKDWDTSQALAKEWCQQENATTEEGNIVDDTLNLCTTAHLGTDLYNTLASQYCVSNPDKDFCKCYNVVNYETVCANRPTSAGCAKAKEAYDKYVEYEIPDPNVWLPCGDACSGVNNYRPPGHDDGCGGTIAACIQNIEVGAAHDEINAACNIDASSGLTTGGSDGSGGSGGSDGSDGSGGSGNVSTSAVEELKKTIAEKEEKAEEEAKKTNKKLLIGGGGGIVSSISCLMFLVIVVVLLSKKKGGSRR